MKATKAPRSPRFVRPNDDELLRRLREFPASGEIEADTRFMWLVVCIQEGLVEELRSPLGFTYCLNEKGQRALQEGSICRAEEEE